MICNRQFASILLWLLALTIALAACSKPETSTLPEESGQPAPIVRDEATQQLPLPPIATVPASGIDVPGPEAIDQSAAATDILSPGSLPLDIQKLIADIQNGDFPVGQPVGSGSGIQATYAYSDVDHDGRNDLVVIVVAEQGGLTGVTAGRMDGNPIIRLAPFASDDQSVQAVDISVEKLVELAQANGTDQDGPFILTLTAEPSN